MAVHESPADFASGDMLFGVISVLTAAPVPAREFVATAFAASSRKS